MPIGMGTHKIYEAEQDGPSVIIWDSGSGVRIVYFTEQQAENATRWLIERANRFHKAKEDNDGSEHELMVTITAFDESMTEFQMVQRFLSMARNAGYEIITGLTRASFEFW